MNYLSSRYDLPAKQAFSPLLFQNAEAQSRADVLVLVIVTTTTTTITIIFVTVGSAGFQSKYSWFGLCFQD
jgi:hypothetical protein